MFRKQLLAVNPDASLLKAPFNDCDRQLVGLAAAWYNPDFWPESDQAHITRTHFMYSPSYTQAESCCPTASELAALRARLSHFAEMELYSSGATGSLQPMPN